MGIFLHLTQEGFLIFSITPVWEGKLLNLHDKFYQDVIKFLGNDLCSITFLFSVNTISLYVTVPEEVVVALDLTPSSDVSGPIA